MNTMSADMQAQIRIAMSVLNKMMDRELCGPRKLYKWGFICALCGKRGKATNRYLHPQWKEYRAHICRACVKTYSPDEIRAKIRAADERSWAEFDAARPKE